MMLNSAGPYRLPRRGSVALSDSSAGPVPTPGARASRFAAAGAESSGRAATPSRLSWLYVASAALFFGGAGGVP